MSDEHGVREPPPWPQRLYDSIWLLAGAALLFFILSYVVWGMVDLLMIGSAR